MKKIIGTKIRPRVSIFRSNKYITGQAIEDETGTTLVSASSKTISGKATSVEKAAATGQAMGKTLAAKKINEIVFDRNGQRYHGQVKAFAEGLREVGIKF